MRRARCAAFVWLLGLHGLWAAAPSGTLVQAPLVSFPAGTYPTRVVAGDFNADGKLDLVVANNIASTDPNHGSVSLLLGNGSGGFTLAGTFKVGGDPTALLAADFNADGKLDIATANFNSMDVSVLLGDGRGNFATASGSPIAMAQQPSSLAVADFNRDGKLDLVVAARSRESPCCWVTDWAGFPPRPEAPSPLADPSPSRSPISISTAKWIWP